jgi:hypothetical protein
MTCLSVSAFAQSSPGFKIYQNTDIFQTRYNESGEETTEDNINFTRISLSLNFLTKKGLVHEVEFFIPEFNKPFEKLQFPMQYEFIKGDKFVNEASSFSMRYEINKLLSDKSDRIVFYFGVGANPYFVHLESTPTTPNAYYISLKYYGFEVNVIPGLNYKINQQFSINLNVPVRMYNFRGVKYRQDNPILPLLQQRTNHIKHLFFEPVYTIRLGLGYRVNN